MSTGSIVQVIGPVVDIRFNAGELPKIYNALVMTDPKLTLEVQPPLAIGAIRSITLMPVSRIS